jgi:16S rRNA C967 or C1407 C5-methylase (RsmB/RsmF family)
VIEGFLGRSAAWTVDPPDDFPVAPDASGFIRLFPHRHGTDGFTAIRLRRR